MALDQSVATMSACLNSPACEQYPFLAQLAESEVVSRPELHMLERLALGQRKADFVERQVLHSIFRRVEYLSEAEQRDGGFMRFREIYDI